MVDSRFGEQDAEVDFGLVKRERRAKRAQFVG